MGVGLVLVSIYTLNQIDSIFPSLTETKKLAILILPASIYAVVAFILRWLLGFAHTPISIGIAVEYGPSGEALWMEAVERIKRSINSLELFNLKLIIYPADVNFDSNIKAENFTDKKGLSVLIWGRIRPGTRNNIETHTFEISVTNHIESEVTRDKTPLRLSLEIGVGIKRTGWTVRAHNTDDELETVKNNIVEIALFALGKCLSHLPTEKYQDDALKILSLVEQRIRAAGIIYPERRETLDQVKIEIRHLYERRANALLFRQNYKSAAVYYNKILQSGLETESILLNLAFSLWSSGEFKESTTVCKRLIKKSPGSPAARFNKAFFAIQAGRYKAAIKQYEILEKRGIGNIEPLYTIEFFHREYEREPARHGLLFASGYINCIWRDKKNGLKELNAFLSRTEQKQEYFLLRKIASQMVRLC